MKKPFDHPVPLKHVLHALTKDELHTIRRCLHVPGASQLNKSELVDCLAAFIPNSVDRSLERMDQPRYQLLKRVLRARDGSLPTIELSDDTVYEPLYFQELGLLFPRDQAVIMPREVREKLLQVDEHRLEPLLERNTQWCRLTQGMLYYYGHLGFPTLVDRIGQYTENPVDDSAYLLVMLELEHYDCSVKASRNGLSFYSVEDPQWVDQEHRSRPDVDYFPFTKGQLLRAADEDYVERHTAFRDFVAFLCTHWEMKADEADLLAQDLVERVRMGQSPSQLVEGLQMELEFTGMEQLQQLMQVLTRLMNNTRLWELKGHTPEELFKREKQPVHARETGVAAAAASANASATIYSFQTKSKVGRNDPCPCGSGKKFKKCCGS